MPPCKIESCPTLTWINAGNPEVVLIGDAQPARPAERATRCKAGRSMLWTSALARSAGPLTPTITFEAACLSSGQTEPRAHAPVARPEEVRRALLAHRAKKRPRRSGVEGRYRPRREASRSKRLGTRDRERIRPEAQTN